MSSNIAAPTYTYDWADLAFGSKKPLRELKAIFIAAPREISVQRFKQLIMQYLPQGNIVLGIAKEDYVLGFENQPQFRMLTQPAIQKVLDQVHNAHKGRTITTLHYFQRELPYILDKLAFKHVVLVNGSWQHVFHSSPAYYYLASTKTPYDLVSPFTDETEARAYEHTIKHENVLAVLDTYKKQAKTEQEIMQLASLVATCSFDYSFQTGAVLAKPVGEGDTLKTIAVSYNKVVPYQTYALHHGSAREKHFSPPHDQSHYDTNHAEVELILQAQKEKLDLHGTTLCINLMPCPSCARMLSQTDIETFVYSIDHSDGYAIRMLEAAGKIIRRVV